MIRDMDLVREILFAIEEHEDATGPEHFELPSDEHSKEVMSYHIMLLDEAGLIIAAEVTDLYGDGTAWHLVRLTWEGHEFAEMARDEKTWKQSMKTVKEKTGALAFGALKMILVKWGVDALAKILLPL